MSDARRAGVLPKGKTTEKASQIPKNKGIQNHMVLYTI